MWPLLNMVFSTRKTFCFLVILLVHCKCNTKNNIKKSKIKFSNTVHFRGKHAWYRAWACIQLKLYMQVVFSCCTFFFFFPDLAPSSNYLKGDCWNMRFKYDLKTHLCTVSFKTNKKSTITNTYVLKFIVILHSCTLQTVITAKV